MSVRLTLSRVSTSHKGTQGVLVHDKNVLCHTLELPWRYNAKNQSSIPAGEYPAFKAHSDKFGRVIYVKSVPDREGILIHCGNTLKDTRGCILVGLDVDQHFLVNSRKAMNRLLDSLPDDFTLTVKENY